MAGRSVLPHLGDSHRETCLLQRPPRFFLVLRLDAVVKAQALGLEALTVAMSQRTESVYTQNTIAATVHRARPSQDGRAICGWNYKGQTFRARR